MIDPYASQSERRKSEPANGPVIGGACQDCQVAREADHRIANHLAMIAGFVRMKSAELDEHHSQSVDPAVALAFEAVRTQINAVADLHRNLAIGQSVTQDLGEHLREICRPATTAVAGQITFVEDFQDGCHVAVDHVIPIGQIVAESVMNAIKHAFPSGRGVIKVGCSTAAGLLCVSVEDDGMGMAPEVAFQEGSALGLRLMKALAKRMHASLTFDNSRRGLKVTLTLEASAQMGR